MDRGSKNLTEGEAGRIIDHLPRYVWIQVTPTARAFGVKPEVFRRVLEQKVATETVERAEIYSPKRMSYKEFFDSTNPPNSKPMRMNSKASATIYRRVK